jgi:hypothetical protein
MWRLWLILWRKPRTHFAQVVLSCKSRKGPLPLFPRSFRRTFQPLAPRINRSRSRGSIARGKSGGPVVAGDRGSGGGMSGR